MLTIYKLYWLTWPSWMSDRKQMRILVKGPSILLLLSIYRHDGFCAINFTYPWPILLNFQHNDSWHRIKVELDLVYGSSTHLQTKETWLSLPGLTSITNKSLDINHVIYNGNQELLQLYHPLLIIVLTL
jgi:hypothetical protein